MVVSFAQLEVSVRITSCLVSTKKRSGENDIVLLNSSTKDAWAAVCGGQMPVTGSVSMSAPVMLLKVTFNGGT